VTGFLLGAAALIVLALGLLLPPLLKRRAPEPEPSRVAINAAIYRDELAELEADLASGSLSQADFEQGRRELQRRLLEDAQAEAQGAPPPGSAARMSAWAVALALPFAAGLAYALLGNPAALDPESTPPQQVTAQQIDEMVARLAARLEQNPDDPKGWVMLARSYKALERYEEAAAAYGKADKLVGEDPNLLADYAETLAFTAGGSLAGKPTELVQRALKLDPDNLHALVLAGAAAYEREEFAAAADHWGRLLKQLPADSEDARSLAQSVENARAAARAQGRQGRRAP
jgi:cytochrome c-type biogenesis protein CcmH